MINENVNKDDNIEDYYIKDVNLVTLEINEDTVTSENATLIITDNNVVAYNFEYYFEIERKKDGGWQEVERLNDRSSLLLGYNRNENNQYIFNTNWKNEYGTLEIGTYRIVKYSEGIKFCSNEFKIK